MSTSPVIVSPTSKHTASVIFLHGLGDTGHGWASSLQALKLPHVKFICPTASVMPVTLNSGFPMPSWFDLKTLDVDGPEDEDGINKASIAVLKMVADEEEKGIPSDKIVLGGFSQGGALAIYSALCYAKPLAGVLGLSCWLPLNKKFPAAIVGNTDVPVLQCHGDIDPVVPHKWGKMTHEVLKRFMSNVELKTYEGLGHFSNDSEMKDVKAFLEKHLH